MRFLSNFRCKIIFMCSVNFWHQQDSNSLFKGNFGHVISWYKWPITVLQARIHSSTVFLHQLHCFAGGLSRLVCNYRPFYQSFSQIPCSFIGN